MLFEVNGIGRLAKDVEIKYTASGTAISLFSLVSSKKYKDQSGQQKEDVCFVECASFGRVAEICNQYLKKGSKIFFRGELKQNTWTDQQNNKRSKHTIAISTIEMLDCKENNQTQQKQPQQSTAPYQQPQKKAPTQKSFEIDSDFIPF